MNDWGGHIADRSTGLPAARERRYRRTGRPGHR